jgi:hypothetical protein
MRTKSFLEDLTKKKTANREHQGQPLEAVAKRRPKQQAVAKSQQEPCKGTFSCLHTNNTYAKMNIATNKSLVN